MSPVDPRDEFEDGDERMLAAEFVLGLIQGPAREALAQRLRDDHTFARDVEFWETRLGPLADHAEAVDVPAYIWRKIEDDLGHRAVPLGTRSASAPTGLWNSLGFWRGLGLAASGLAAACLAFILLAPPAPTPNLVAMLKMDDGRSGFMASVDPSTGKIMLMPAIDTAAPADHTHELWLIPVGGAPQSLGTFVARGPVTISMPKQVMPNAAPDAVLAISVEPMGGSPTGQPTGPVVAQGEMQNI